MSGTTYTFTRSADSLTFHADFGGMQFDVSVKGNLTRLKDVEAAAMKGVALSLAEFHATQARADEAAVNAEAVVAEDSAE